LAKEKPIDEEEQNLWHVAAQRDGTDRADAYVALGRMAFEKGKFKESLAMCEIAREIFEQASINDYPVLFFSRIDLGTEKNLKQLLI
jgi:hypothetical protein